MFDNVGSSLVIGIMFGVMCSAGTTVLREKLNGEDIGAAWGLLIPSLILWCVFIFSLFTDWNGVIFGITAISIACLLQMNPKKK